MKKAICFFGGLASCTGAMQFDFGVQGSFVVGILLAVAWYTLWLHWDYP